MRRRTLGLIALLPTMAGGLIWLSMENADLRERLAAASDPRQSPVRQAMIPASTKAGPLKTNATPKNKTPGPIAQVQPLPGSLTSVQALSQLLVSTPGSEVVVQDPMGGPGYKLSSEDVARLAQEIKNAQIEKTTKFPNGPSWSPGQAAGPPNTERHGDYATAWASQSPDGGAEWLKVKFDKSVEVGEINIHESYNPGAVSKVSVILPDGGRKVIWEGVESPENGVIERALKVPPGVRSDQLLIELDTARVPGWNEIDAVEIVGRDGFRQWAAESTASSFYGASYNHGVGFRGGYQSNDLLLEPLGE